MSDRVNRLLAGPAAAALAALASVALVAGYPAAGLAAATGALTVVCGLVLGPMRRDPARTLLGALPASRALLVGVAGLAVVDTADHVWRTVLAAALLTGLLVGERLIQRAAQYKVPEVAHLPTLPSPRSLPDLSMLVVLTHLAAVAGGLLIAAIDAAAEWWLALAGLALLPTVLVLTLGRVKKAQADRLSELLPAAVARYAPAFVVYTSRPDDASYQVTMWLPYLERAGLPFLIVTRTAVPAKALARLTDVPVVEARALATVDALVVPSLKAAFYVNASSGNGALVRNTGLQHVYVGHGDSDKPPSYNPTHAMYDQIFAAGPAAIRRYAAHGVQIPEEKFRIVGRPQVEHVQPAMAPIRTVDNPAVLYAPTWRGHVEETMLYSLPVGEAIIRGLLRRETTVIFRPHPFSYDYPEDAHLVRRIQQLLASDAQATGRRHLWGPDAETSRSILDCINAADAMISDVSSVVSDFLFSGKPLAMVAVPADPEPFAAEYPIARAAYVLRGDLGNLEPVLDQMLGPDPMADERARVRSDYLGEFAANTYASAFIDAVRAAASGDTELMAEENEPEGDAEPAADGAAGTRDKLRLLRRTIRLAGLPAAAAALAIGALGSVLAMAPAWLTAGLIVLSLGLVGVSSRTVFQAPHRAAQRGIAEVARALLIVVLGTVAVLDGQHPVGTALLVVLLATALTLETFVQSAYALAHAEVRNFPALAAEGAATAPALLTGGGVTGLVLSFLLTALGLPLWPAALLVLGTAAAAIARTPVTPTQVIRANDRLRTALDRLAPQFAVYFSSTVGADYQVGMWLPYFARIGRPWVVVVRTTAMMLEITQAMAHQRVSAPIIFRPTLRSVEEVIVPSMSAAFYVNNAARNTHFVERRELTHVWLNHGDSEKPACFNPVHAIYDLIFAAGQAGIDRYARHGVSIPQEKFRIVGRPQVERIGPARAPISTIEAPTVLYAPTWQGPFADSRVYSLPIGRQIVAEALRRGARVICRTHPFNYRYIDARELISDIGALLDADRARTGRAHLWGPAAELAMSIEDCFNASDVMISDVSAVVSDFLHSGKPLAMVSMGRTPEQLAVDAPAARAAYVLREDLSNLVQVFDDLLGADPLAPDRQQAKIYYLGDFPAETYAEGFLQAARKVIDTGRNPI